MIFNSDECIALAECLEGIDAHTIKGYMINDNDSGKQVHIPYPVKDGQTVTGAAFHHGRFVSALRKTAMAEPKYVLYGYPAKEVIVL